MLAEGNSIISNRWKTWDREQSIFYENPEHFSCKSLHLHCIVIAKINQYFLFLFQLWTVRQPNPEDKKDTNHSLKETHRNTVLFDVKTLFWFEKFGSETKLSVWWVKLDHYCIVDQTYLESKQGNLEVLAKMKTKDYKLNSIWDMNPIFWKHPKICKGSFLMYQTFKSHKIIPTKNDDCKKGQRLSKSLALTSSYTGTKDGWSSWL